MYKLPPECRAFREGLIGSGVATGGPPGPVSHHGAVCGRCRGLARMTEELAHLRRERALVTAVLRRDAIEAALRRSPDLRILTAAAVLAFANVAAGLVPIVLAAMWLAPLLGSQALALGLAGAVLAPAGLAAAAALALTLCRVPVPAHRNGGVE